MRHFNGRSASGRHTHQAAQAAAIARGENDDALIVPCCAARSSTGRISEYLRRTAGQIDPFQLAGSKKADRVAIRRPKRIGGALGARENLHTTLIEGTHRELLWTGRTRDEGHPPSVGRQGKLEGQDGAGRADFEARHHGLNRRSAHVDDHRRCDHGGREQRATKSRTPIHASPPGRGVDCRLSGCCQRLVDLQDGNADVGQAALSVFLQAPPE
jgi:hypothetical protein